MKTNNSPAKVAAFGSGGVMEKYCKENQIFFQKIPMIHSPRASFTNFLFSILNILESIIPVKKSDVLESISILEKTRDNIFSGNLTAENQSLKLANYIKQTPCIPLSRCRESDTRQPKVDFLGPLLGVFFEWILSFTGLVTNPLILSSKSDPILSCLRVEYDFWLSKKSLRGFAQVGDWL